MTNIFVTEFAEFSKTGKTSLSILETHNTAFEPKTGVHGIIGAQHKGLERLQLDPSY